MTLFLFRNSFSVKYILAQWKYVSVTWCYWNITLFRNTWNKFTQFEINRIWLAPFYWRRRRGGGYGKKRCALRKGRGNKGGNSKNSLKRNRNRHWHKTTNQQEYVRRTTTTPPPPPPTKTFFRIFFIWLKRNATHTQFIPMYTSFIDLCFYKCKLYTINILRVCIIPDDKMHAEVTKFFWLSCRSYENTYFCLN